ncbi:MAG: DUF397 domain-containing protein [Actinobacteria bacterium]|nr:DUF397 domain-containing protein [Actinomycetota bacterium]
MKITAWRKSSYSGGGQQDCVEVGRAPGLVGVRDSKLPADQPVITVTRTAWTAFVRHVSR